MVEVRSFSMILLLHRLAMLGEAFVASSGARSQRINHPLVSPAVCSYRLDSPIAAPVSVAMTLLTVNAVFVRLFANRVVNRMRIFAQATNGQVHASGPCESS